MGLRVSNDAGSLLPLRKTMAMKTTVQITLDNGVLSYAATCDVAGTIAVLEHVKHAIISQSLGGVGRPPESGAAVDGGRRAPGLTVRHVDSER